MNKNHYVIGASLDMTSAYDLLSYQKIEEILNKRQVDPIFTNWYMDFLRNRTISIENKGVKLRRKAFRGVMQGSIISPAIFGTVVNELLELFDEDEGDGKAYLIPQLAHQQSSPKASPVKVIEDLNRNDK